MIENGSVNVKETSSGKESFFNNEDIYEERLANLMASLYDKDIDESLLSVEKDMVAKESNESKTCCGKNVVEIVEAHTRRIDNLFNEMNMRLFSSLSEERALVSRLSAEIASLREENRILQDKINSQITSKASVNTQTEDVDIVTVVKKSHTEETSIATKISAQLIEVRGLNKDKYYAHKELQNPKRTDVVTDIVNANKSEISQTPTIIETPVSSIPEKDKSAKPLPPQQNQINKNAGKVHTWKKGTTLIVGDSMLGGIKEALLAPRNNVKVRSFPGATISDMRDYMRPLLRKKPSRILIHVGTNDAPNSDAQEIVSNLINLKNFVTSELDIPVIISSPVNRYDNENLSNTIRNVNAKLKNVPELDIIYNDN